ncbi:Disease resistance protein [Artemisia annua]|uniref:Disease resistance protein n=1 Tax=Artemisia annua TaxID=35608 RepID=A0A2U1N1T3_ARTAN|nr:Disease resistance protein [Artemisia annua]
MKDLEKRRYEIKAHVYYNNTNNLEIPPSVPQWLEDVEKIEKNFKNIPSNNDGCFNLKTTYEAEGKALKLTKKIDDLITQSKEIIWTNAKIPLGRVDSKRPPSTSASGGNNQNGFKSRNKIFNDALKFLQHDDGKTQVIALCGMGGVRKTTLMNQLKEAAKNEKMFQWIMVLIIGKSSNLFAHQNAIAVHTESFQSVKKESGYIGRCVGED